MRFTPLRKIAGILVLGAVSFTVGCESVALLPREDIDRRSAERRDDSGRDRFDARDEVYGAVQDVDERRREIRVRTEAGRTSIVRYDAETRIYDGNRELRPDSIRSGDEVAVRFGRDRGGEDYAAAIRVMDRRGSRSR